MSEYEDTAPEVTWAMPADAPSHVDVAKRNEYVDDALRKAAEIMWLLFEATGIGAGMPPREDIPPEFLEAELVALQAVLLNGGRRWDGREEFWRWRGLQIVNLPKILASSSAMRERGQS